MPFDPLTIVSVIVAVFVAWKLHSVLGQSTGFQRQRPPVPPEPRIADRDNAGPAGNVVRLPGSEPSRTDQARWNAFIEPGTNPANGLEAISGADPAFSAAPFLEGARTAYEAIVTAFASGDRRALQHLLAPDVYDGFNSALIDREQKHETLTTTFVSLGDAKIRSAFLDSPSARVSVRFLSKQISATHGPDGALISGSPDRVVDMNDVWTFARDVPSRDPNWKLVATESGH